MNKRDDYMEVKVTVDELEVVDGMTLVGTMRDVWDKTDHYMTWLMKHGTIGSSVSFKIIAQ